MRATAPTCGFDEAIKFIGENRDQPFFCYISTNAPHAPYNVEDRYWKQYEGKTDSEEAARFFGMISNIDENFGKLRAALLRWPEGGLDEGRDVDALTSNVDMMPTLLELCGVNPGEHAFDGQSLMPLLYEQDTAWPDRIMVTDSQRIAYPIKWRKSATMSQRWRLINGTELYDIQQDPEQRHDAASEHPEVVKWLKEGYEAWWAKVSRQFESTVPVTVGRKVGAVERLTTHDWRNDPVACAWNQAQIRAGIACNGYWEIEVAEPGRYRFELRRWPREEDRAVTAGIPGPLKPFRAEIKDGWGGGKALPLVRAAMRISENRSGNIDDGDGAVVYESAKSIDTDDINQVFRLDLGTGEYRLQTYLHDPGGNTIGAYYVYVERLG